MKEHAGKDLWDLSEFSTTAGWRFGLTGSRNGGMIHVRVLAVFHVYRRIGSISTGTYIQEVYIFTAQIGWCTYNRGVLYDGL